MTPTPGAGTQSPKIGISKGGALAGYLTVGIVAAAAFLVTQLAGQLLDRHNPFTRMRTLYWHDQLGYLAIASNVRNGDLSSTEPLTETGVSHYPRLYYSLVGLLSRATGWDLFTAWNVLGMVLQVAAVVTLALVMSSLSRRWWLGLLSPLVFLTGVFAYLQTDSWFIILQRHAVLWGPYGALFSKNAESAGLSVGVIAIALLMWTWCRLRSRAVRWTVTLIVSAALGALSAFQTYSFLIMTFVVVFAAAATAIARSRRPYIHLAVSVSLLAMVAACGPLVADRIGQLPTLIFGLLPAVPGIVLAILQSRGLVLAAAATAVAAALPQVLFTAAGVIDGDPFLLYRVASNHLLGVVSWQALLGALPVLIPLIGAAVLGLAGRDPAVIGPSIGGGVALVFLAVNDLWGANAEPYRFWINGILIGGVLAALAWGRIVRRTEPAYDDGTMIPYPRRAWDTSMMRRTAVVFLSVTALVYAAAFPDWVRYIRNDEAQHSWSPRTEREEATAALAAHAAATDESLILPDRCVDPRTTKANSGARIAYYHLGMAWPARKDAIDAAHAGRETGSLDFDAMADANIGWLITDSECGYDWGATYSDRLLLVEGRSYELIPDEVATSGQSRSGEIRLWQIITR